MKSFTIPIRLSLTEAANLIYWLRQEGILAPTIGQAVKLTILAALDGTEAQEFEEGEEEAAEAYLKTTLGKKLPRLQKADLKKSLNKKKGDSFIKEEGETELYLED